MTDVLLRDIRDRCALDLASVGLLEAADELRLDQTPATVLHRRFVIGMAQANTGKYRERHATRERCAVRVSVRLAHWIAPGKQKETIRLVDDDATLVVRTLAHSTATTLNVTRIRHESTTPVEHPAKGWRFTDVVMALEFDLALAEAS